VIAAKPVLPQAGGSGLNVKSFHRFMLNRDFEHPLNRTILSEKVCNYSGSSTGRFPRLSRFLGQA
jgi:hypothetical protein